MKNMFEKSKKKTPYEDFYQKSIDILEKKIDHLEKELIKQQQSYETTLSNLKLTESQKTSEPLKQENSSISHENETIFHEEPQEEFDEPEYIVLSKPTPKRQKVIDILEKEAVKAISSNRREIIKGKIEEELRKKELSAKELKILFVDEYEYCSKATFYRYLESLREEHRIDSIKINGKEYLCSIPSTINHRNQTDF